jgi:hypothetical protein
MSFMNITKIASRARLPLLTLLGAALALFFLARPRPNPYLGRALKAILPKEREDITVEDLRKLSRQQLIGVFHQLVSPETAEMRGEYRAAMLDTGNAVNRFLSHFSLYRIWGEWGHKAFEPIGEKHGHGYNTFSTCLPEVHENVHHALLDRFSHVLRHFFVGDPCQERTVRIIRNRTYTGPSMFDNRTSFHLVYHPYNDFPVSTMHDEVRKVNDTLFLGLGILTVTGGKWNIFPFVLTGPPEPWKGPDDGYPDRPAATIHTAMKPGDTP